MDRYRVEYSKSPLVNEVQALTVSCESQSDTQVVTTSASAIPEVQLIHLKMDPDMATNYPGMTIHEIQASSDESPTRTVIDHKGVRHYNKRIQRLYPCYNIYLKVLATGSIGVDGMTLNFM